jgi:succinyl-diaminopimelate desuccinylase
MRAADEVDRWAAEDHAGVVALTQQLVRISSRGGIDPYQPALDALRDWFTAHELPTRTLGTTEPLGLVCDVHGAQAGPRYVLNACVDTAPFGDTTAWRHPPTSGMIEDGWLYGRGAADSKAAAAVFAHIAARLSRQRDRLHGTLTVLLDADEHTGRFGGARAFFSGTNDVAGVMIGYPGYDHLVIGGRGFLRARVVVHGRARHTGSSTSTGYENAVERAADVVKRLAAERTPGPVDPILGLPPKLTVTAIHAGEGFSVVPDRCVVNVDVRLTTTFAADEARALLAEVAAPDRQPSTTVEYEESWPAYRLAESAPIRAALLSSAARHLSRPPDPRIAGPSNIGSYLAGLGIDATAGLGVGYENLHGTDERIDLATIPMIQATYHDAVLALLSNG